jgi:hypothetical protein
LSTSTIRFWVTPSASTHWISGTGQPAAHRRGLAGVLTALLGAFTLDQSLTAT